MSDQLVEVDVARHVDCDREHLRWVVPGTNNSDPMVRQVERGHSGAVVPVEPHDDDTSSVVHEAQSGFQSGSGGVYDDARPLAPCGFQDRVPLVFAAGVDNMA